MEAILWIALALALVGLGGTVTWLVGTLVPEPVFERAQQHGRFAGLEPRPPRGGGRGRRVRRVRHWRLVALSGPMGQLVPVRI
jgi:membrane protein YqaA with SNARE-associated domain